MDEMSEDRAGRATDARASTMGHLTRLRYVSRAESIPTARRHVDRTLDGISPETRSAIILMVSELATNAVRHTNSATFEVLVEQTAERVRVRVTDDGGGTPVVRAPSITDLSGRGLRIVIQLSDRFGIELAGDATTVWFEVIVGAPPLSVGERERDGGGQLTAEPSNTGWAHLDSLEKLSEYVSSRLADLGAEAAAIGVVDVLDDPQSLSVSATLSGEVAAALRQVVLDTQGPEVLSLRSPTSAETWRVRTLTSEGRTVGGVAWLSRSDAGLDDLGSVVVNELAIAMDVASARISSRRLRKGLHALVSIGADISRAFTAQDVAISAEREARTALGAQACYLYRLTKVGAELVVAEGRDDEPWPVILLEQSTPVSDCIRAQAPVICASRKSIVERYGWVTEYADVSDQSWVAFPIRLESRPVGALFFSCAEPRTWTADELDIAAAIAHQCAQALERIDTQGELDALRDERSELRFRAALDVMADLVAIESAVRDETGRIVNFRIEYMNRADIDVAGRSTSDLTGRMLSDAYPAAAATELLARFADVVETGHMFLVEELPYSDTINGQSVHGTYRMQAAKFGDGVIVSARRSPPTISTPEG